MMYTYIHFRVWYLYDFGTTYEKDFVIAPTLFFSFSCDVILYIIIILYILIVFRLLNYGPDREITHVCTRQNWRIQSSVSVAHVHNGWNDRDVDCIEIPIARVLTVNCTPKQTCEYRLLPHTFNNIYTRVTA